MEQLQQVNIHTPVQDVVTRSHLHSVTSGFFFFPNAAFVQSFIFYIKGWQDGTGSTTVVCFLETGRRPRSHSPLPTVILEPTGSWWCTLLKYSFNLLVLLLQTSEAATKHLADESQWCRSTTRPRGGFLRQNDQRKQQKKSCVSLQRVRHTAAETHWVFLKTAQREEQHQRGTEGSWKDRFRMTGGGS